MNQYNATPRESVIRDHLAQNLSLLEDGLILKQIEMRVENPDGADGFIDIFAEDRWNHKVVIELKRSDQASRQALHEVFKYVELLKRHSGIKDSQLRVIIISTTWHELLVPFSACIRDVAFHLEGFQIVVDPQGNVIKSEIMEPLKEGHLLDFINHHGIFLYSNSDDRDNELPSVTNALSKLGVNNKVLFAINYKGSNPAVIYKYAILVALATVPIEEAKDKISSLGNLSDYENMENQSDMPVFDFWQYHYFNEVLAKTECNNDTFEICYPEKADAINHDWELSKVVREGHWAGKESIYSDTDLWQTLFRFQGGNAYKFKKTTSPRFAKEWAETIGNARYTMQGYDPWIEFYEHYLNEISRMHPNAEVKISIYNHFDLLLSFYMLLIHGDFRYLPMMNILVTDHGAKREKYIMSSIAWNGKHLPVDPTTLITRIFKDPEEYFWYRHLGQLHLYFKDILKLHELDMPIMEIDGAEGLSPRYFAISVQDGQLNRMEKAVLNPSDTDIFDYFESNREYFMSFIELWHRYSNDPLQQLEDDNA